MADDIQSNIRINIDTASAMDSIRLLQAQISAFHTQMSKMGAANAATAANMQQNLINSINASGKFAASITKIKTSAESFTTALEKNKLSLREYFRYAGASSKSFGKYFATEFETINKVARERVKDLQSQYIKLGRDANGAMQAIKVRPLILDMENLGTKTQIAAQRQQLLNQLLKQGSTNLLNFGKNTQWAGRQLMVGFTVPLTIMGGAAVKSYEQMEQAAVKFKRVYGDMGTTNAQTEQMVKQVQKLALEYTKYGIAVADTMDMAAQAAAMGKTGTDLLQQISNANKLSALGGVEQNKALETTISLTNAFGIASKDLGENINFLNSVENQTVLNIDDMTTAIPKAAPVIKQLGGNVKDLAFFLTAMKEGGINASEGANAIKSGLASIINPTNTAKKMLQGFGINLTQIVEKDKGNLRKTVVDFAQALDTLDPLSRARAIEKMFGKFQFARISTLFQNITQQGTQASKVLELANASSVDLALMSQAELKKVQSSPLFQFKKAIADFQNSLIPIGEQFLKALTPIIKFGQSLLDGFNKLDGGVKSFIVNIVGIGGIIGPVLLMTFGLLANAVANVIKGFSLVKGIFNGAGKSSLSLGEQVNYMTQEQIQAAAVASSLDQVHSKLKQTFTSEAAAVEILTAAYERQVAAQRALNVPITPRGPIKKYASGGIISGPGTGTSDSIPAMLSHGEAVIPAKSVLKYPYITQSLINGNIPGFSTGGIVGIPSKTLLQQVTGNSAVIAYGAHQPFTTAHQNIAQSGMAMAQESGIPFFQFTSNQGKSKRSILDDNLKSRMIYEAIGRNPEFAKNPFELMSILSNAGIKNVKILLGQDRMGSRVWDAAAKEYGINLAKIGVSRPAGSPSGTLARAAATSGNIGVFEQLLASGISRSTKNEIFNSILNSNNPNVKKFARGGIISKLFGRSMPKTNTSLFKNNGEVILPNGSAIQQGGFASLAEQAIYMQLSAKNYYKMLELSENPTLYKKYLNRLLRYKNLTKERQEAILKEVNIKDFRRKGLLPLDLNDPYTQKIYGGYSGFDKTLSTPMNSPYKFASGGIISGTGTGTSDSILARVSNGEAIIPANSVARNPNLVNQLVSGNIPGFADGIVLAKPKASAKSESRNLQLSTTSTVDQSHFSGKTEMTANELLEYAKSQGEKQYLSTKTKLEREARVLLEQTGKVMDYSSEIFQVYTNEVVNLSSDLNNRLGTSGNRKSKISVKEVRKSLSDSGEFAHTQLAQTMKDMGASDKEIQDALTKVTKGIDSSLEKLGDGVKISGEELDKIIKTQYDKLTGTAKSAREEMGKTVGFLTKKQGDNSRRDIAGQNAYFRSRLENRIATTEEITGKSRKIFAEKQFLITPTQAKAGGAKDANIVASAWKTLQANNAEAADKLGRMVAQNKISKEKFVAMLEQDLLSIGISFQDIAAKYYDQGMTEEGEMKSPSRKAKKRGKDTVKGAIDGMDSEVPKAKKAGEKLGTAVSDGIVSSTKRGRRVSTAGESFTPGNMIIIDGEGSQSQKSSKAKPKKVVAEEPLTRKQRFGSAVAKGTAKIAGMGMKANMTGFAISAGLSMLGSVGGPIGEISNQLSMFAMALTSVTSILQFLPETLFAVEGGLMAGIVAFAAPVAIAVGALALLAGGIYLVVKAEQDRIQKLKEATIGYTASLYGSAQSNASASIFGYQQQPSAASFAHIGPSPKTTKDLKSEERSQKIIATDEFKKNFTGAGSIVESLKGMSPKEVNRNLQLIAQKNIAEGNSEEGAMALIKAIQLAAKRTDVKLNFKSVLVNTKEGKAQFAKNASDIAEDFAKNVKIQYARVDTRGGNYFIKNTTSKDSLEKLKIYSTNLKTMFESIGTQFKNGTISADDYSKSFNNLLSSIQKFGGKSANSLIQSIINKMPKDIQTALSKVNKLTEGFNLLFKAMNAGMTVSKDIIDALSIDISKLPSLEAAVAAYAKQQGALEELKKEYKAYIKIVKELTQSEKTTEQKNLDIWNAKINNINSALDILSRKEDIVNKAYDKRLKALDDIQKANEVINQQSQDQLDLADALSKGDIAAAARAQAKMTSDAATAANDAAKTNLETGRQNALASLTVLDKTGKSYNRQTLEGMLAIVQNLIDTQTLKGFNFSKYAKPKVATGGHITGPGTGTSDSIPAMLSNGEYVIRANAVKTIGVDTLNKLNQADKMKFANGGIARYAPGGYIGPRPAPQWDAKGRWVVSHGESYWSTAENTLPNGMDVGPWWSKILKSNIDPETGKERRLYRNSRIWIPGSQQPFPPKSGIPRIFSKNKKPRRIFGTEIGLHESHAGQGGSGIGGGLLGFGPKLYANGGLVGYKDGGITDIFTNPMGWLQGLINGMYGSGGNPTSYLNASADAGVRGSVKNTKQFYNDFIFDPSNPIDYATTFIPGGKVLKTGAKLLNKTSGLEKTINGLGKATNSLKFEYPLILKTPKKNLGITLKDLTNEAEGVTPGAYRNIDGFEYYVKRPETSLEKTGELISSTLWAKLGLGGPKLQMINKTTFASKIIPNLIPSSQYDFGKYIDKASNKFEAANNLVKALKEYINEALPTNALLGNYDTHAANILFNKDTKKFENIDLGITSLTSDGVWEIASDGVRKVKKESVQDLLEKEFASRTKDIVQAMKTSGFNLRQTNDIFKKNGLSEISEKSFKNAHFNNFENNSTHEKNLTPQINKIAHMLGFDLKKDISKPKNVAAINAMSNPFIKDMIKNNPELEKWLNLKSNPKNLNSGISGGLRELFIRLQETSKNPIMKYVKGGLVGYKNGGKAHPGAWNTGKYGTGKLGKSFNLDDPYAPWNQGDYKQFNDLLTRKQYWAMAQPGSKELVDVGKTAGYFVPGIGAGLSFGDAGTAFNKGDVGGGILNSAFGFGAMWIPKAFGLIGKGFGAAKSSVQSGIAMMNAKKILAMQGGKSAGKLTPQIGVKMTSQGLANFISEGKYKTVFDNVPSSAKDSPDERTFIELATGIRKALKLKPGQSPAYGFLGTKESTPLYHSSIYDGMGNRSAEQIKIDSFNKMINPYSRALQSYGSNILNLKPSALKNATVSFGDTLSIYQQAASKALSKAGMSPQSTLDIFKMAFGMKTGTPQVLKLNSLLTTLRLSSTARKTKGILGNEFAMPYAEIHMPSGFGLKDVSGIGVSNEFKDRVPTAIAAVEEMLAKAGIINIPVHDIIGRGKNAFENIGMNIAKPTQKLSILDKIKQYRNMFEKTDADGIPVYGIKGKKFAFQGYEQDFSGLSDTGVNIVKLANRKDLEVPKGFIGASAPAPIAMLEAALKLKPGNKKLQSMLDNFKTMEIGKPETAMLDKIIASISIGNKGKLLKHENTDGFATMLASLIGNRRATRIIKNKTNAMHRIIDDNIKSARQREIEDYLKHEKKFGGYGEAPDPSQITMIHSSKHPIIRDKDGNINLHPLGHFHPQYARPSLHFTAEDFVKSHLYGSWNSSENKVVSSLSSIIKDNGLPANLYPLDTWWMRNPGKPLKLSNSSVIRPFTDYKAYTDELVARGMIKPGKMAPVLMIDPKTNDVLYSIKPEYTWLDRVQIQKMLEKPYPSYRANEMQGTEASILEELSLDLAKKQLGINTQKARIGEHQLYPDFRQKEIDAIASKLGIPNNRYHTGTVSELMEAPNKPKGNFETSYNKLLFSDASIESIRMATLKGLFETITNRIMPPKNLERYPKTGYPPDLILPDVQGSTGGLFKNGKFHYAKGGLVPKYFAMGGYARGGDVVPAMLTPGEFVVKKPAADRIGASALNNLNNGKSLTAAGDSVYNTYSINVNVSSNSSPQEIANTVMNTIRRVDNQRIRSTRV